MTTTRQQGTRDGWSAGVGYIITWSLVLVACPVAAAAREIRPGCGVVIISSVSPHTNTGLLQLKSFPSPSTLQQRPLLKVASCQCPRQMQGPSSWLDKL